ncbi:ionotropic receptor 21a-like isoform X1 [Panulirus ornatus]|uniref:ionotropic receptor 21a-like isoform X1 n=1 Tax=Panulirus ornatus TaxID=150431 RepID=UPI003A866D01
MVAPHCGYPLLMVGCLAVLVICQVTGVATTGRADLGDDLGRDLGVLVRQVVEERLAQCSLVLLGESGYGGAIFHILRSLDDDGGGVLYPRLVVGWEEMYHVVTRDNTTPGHLATSSWRRHPATSSWRHHPATSSWRRHLATSSWRRHLATSSWRRLTHELRHRRSGRSCWAMVADVRHNQHLVFRYLEVVEVYKWPETYVVLVGPKSQASVALHDHSLRNSPKLLYLAYLQQQSLGQQPRTTTASHVVTTTTWLAGPNDPPGYGSDNNHGNNPRLNEVVSVVASNTVSGLQEMSTEWRWVYLYTRCMYCTAARDSVQLLHTWTASGGLHNQADLFPDQFQDFHGHTFRLVTMNWFPFIQFQRHTHERGSLVTPLDSLDVRMLTTIANKLNFTYEMRVPWDDQWGTSTPSGNWSGIVGTLQHHQADFSMMLSWLETRLPVLDYSTIYASEPLVMITSKPLPLSQAFALVRPFSVQLWLVTVVSTMVATVVLWALQKAWAWAWAGYALSLDQAMMLTWAILLEDPPPRLPRNITAQMLLGWWWLYCMLLAITYRSSLIAHLTVPGKSVSLDSLEQLLEASKRQHWTWGYEPTYGSGWEWLKTNESPTVKQIFNNIKLSELQEQLELVLAGHHAFITWKYYIRSIIAAHYTDARGYTPIHTAREDFFKYGGYGWGYRKGAPFRHKIDKLKSWLKEGGFINLWLDQLIDDSGRAARMRKKEEEGRGGDDDEKNRKQGNTNEVGSQVVLGLGHLQGVFYLLIMGYGLSLVAFLAERVAHTLHTTKPRLPPI